MKKSMIALLFVVASLHLSAQIRKGQWLAGGSANWTTSHNTDFANGNTTVISIMPDAGYFFIDKLAGGLRLNYSITNPGGSQAYDTYGFAPFVRYYVLPAEKNVNVFAEIASGWDRDYSGAFRGNTHQWSISAGPSVFINPHVALEFELNYSYYSGSNYSYGDAQTIGINIGFQIHLGK